MSGTPSVPEWYINFQAAVIKQLPRPGDISQDVAEGWEGNQASLAFALARALLSLEQASTQPEVVAKPVTQPPDLRQTGKTFGDWLTAREILHESLTGEKVSLREMFVIPEDVLVRTDIMPVFRPAGATNRMAMEWRVRLGEVAPYEEVDVMKYTNSEGPKVPELYYINRSVMPDADTLGNNAMSSDGLVETKKLWTGLYGWSDADLLHFLITGEHLDSGSTWTRFPNDRLSLGALKVALAGWYVSRARAKFFWNNRRRCLPPVGARSATPLSLKS